MVVGLMGVVHLIRGKDRTTKLTLLAWASRLVPVRVSWRVQSYMRYPICGVATGHSGLVLAVLRAVDLDSVLKT